jgi:hypothetical protein
MTQAEIQIAVLAIPSGKADVINGRCVCLEDGWYYLEKHGNKKFSWSEAVRALSRVRKG